MQVMIDEINLYRFVPDASDPHYSKFLKIGKTIKKVADNHIFQCIFGKRIYPNNYSSYSVQQISGKSRSIMYGIGTRALRGKNNPYNHAELISLYAHSGFFWACGSNSNSGSGPIKQFERVEVRVNTF